MSAEDEDFAKFAASITMENPVVASSTDADPPPKETVVDELTETPEAEAETPKPVVEAKVEAAPKVEEKKVDWAAAAAKEKARREAKSAARTEHEELKLKAAKYDAIEEAKKTGSLKAIEALGFTYDQATEEYLKALEKDPNSAPAMTAEQKRIADLEARIEAQEAEKKTERAEALQSRRNETMRQLETSISDVVKSKADDFELLGQEDKGTEIVINLLVAYREKNGEVLDIQEACRLVEEDLREDVKKKAKTKYVRSLVEDKSSTSTTLSSGMRQAVPRGASSSDEDKEFIEQALRLHSQQI